MITLLVSWPPCIRFPRGLGLRITQVSWLLPLFIKGSILWRAYVQSWLHIWEADYCGQWTRPTGKSGMENGHVGGWHLAEALPRQVHASWRSQQFLCENLSLRTCSSLRTFYLQSSLLVCFSSSILLYLFFWSCRFRSYEHCLVSLHLHLVVCIAMGAFQNLDSLGISRWRIL